MHGTLPLALGLLLCVGPAHAQRPRPANLEPRALGKVAFARDADRAFALAKRTGKPILVYFHDR